MTALGPHASPPSPSTVDRMPSRARRRWGLIGTYLWALLPLFTCGFGAPIGFATALARRRETWTLVALVVHSALLVAGCGIITAFGEFPPLWADVLFAVTLLVPSIVGTAHLLLIRSTVWAPSSGPQVLVARLSSAEVVDRARKLREQARRTAEADPMLAKRLGIGRPDLPRQFDDGGLVDLNHAPLHVLNSLPGVTERSARQIQDWVERSGPFGSLGEVMLVIEISPTFEHHLREYCVFIP